MCFLQYKNVYSPIQKFMLYSVTGTWKNVITEKPTNTFDRIVYWTWTAILVGIITLFKARTYYS